MITVLVDNRHTTILLLTSIQISLAGLACRRPYFIQISLGFPVYLILLMMVFLEQKITFTFYTHFSYQCSDNGLETRGCNHMTQGIATLVNHFQDRGNNFLEGHQKLMLIKSQFLHFLTEISRELQ